MSQTVLVLFCMEIYKTRICVVKSIVVVRDIMPSQTENYLYTYLSLICMSNLI